MPGGALADAENIRITNHDFKNDNWKNAAMEIQQFFDEGVTSFLGMEERGDFSRPHYQAVFRDHFEIVGEGSEPQPPTDIESIEAFKSGYRMGFEDGVDWHREQIKRDRSEGGKQ